MSFSNGKLHGYDVGQDAYRKQTVKRGDRGYVIGRSDMHEIACCPHKWLVSGEEDDDSTSATDWGTLLDAMLFNGDMSAFVVRPETYQSEDKKGVTTEKPWNSNSNKCQDWLADAENRGLVVVKPDVMRQAKIARDVFMRDGQLSALLKGARYQAHATADWTDAETGIVIPVKILVDIIPPADSKAFGSSLADGKTARNGAYGSWGRVCFDSWYHVQGSLYLDVWNAATGEGRTRFLHAVQENTPPYEVGRRELLDQLLRLGQGQYEAALKVYAQCLSTGIWPGLDNDGEWTGVDAEPWMLMRSGVSPKDSVMPF